MPPTKPDARNVIEEGRIRWRRRQLAAMVRDNPEEAVRVLSLELGYSVLPPVEPPEVRYDRIRRW